MPYTRKWSNLLPSPNRPGGQLDDTMRELRVDLEERMQTVLTDIGDWTSDPVVADITYYDFIHWSAFRTLNDLYGNTAGVAAGEWTSTLFNQGVRITGSGNLTVYAPISLPMQATLVDVDLSVITTTSTTVVGTAYEVDPTALTLTSLATRTFTGVVAQGNYSLSSGGLINRVIVPDQNEIFYVQLVITNSNVGAANFGIQGMRVTYTRHPLRYV